MLTPFAEGVWTVERPLRSLGLLVGTRMTVLRLNDGGLLLHSPVQQTPELRAAVDALGPVKMIVAPNRYHHLFVGDWMQAHPSARSFGAAGLDRKRKDLTFTDIVDGAAPAGWPAEIGLVRWNGVPMMNELMLLHRASGTLVVTDAVHNLGPSAAGGTRFAFKLIGGYGGVRTSLVDRMITRDRAAARASLEEVLAWKFDRLIMAHGDPVLAGGYDAFAAAYAWLRV